MDSDEEQRTPTSDNFHTPRGDLSPSPSPSPQTFKNERIADIINKLMSDAKIFYSKAKAYREHEELEGCLINLSLASNNLYQAINIITKYTNADNNIDIQILKKNDDGYLANENCSINHENFGNCKSDIEKILKIVLEEIRPLQQKLKSQKTSNKLYDEDDNNCNNVYETPLYGKNCVFFKNVVGCDNAKKQINDCFINTFKYPNLFKDGTRSILLYGPPGTGKTMMVKAAINELNNSSQQFNIHFFAPLAAELKGKYVGDTENFIKNYFECASKAACNDEKKSKEKGATFKRNISILFLDEVEALGGSRSNETNGEGMTSSVNTLLQMMDGVSSKPNLVVFAATNYPWKLDGALLRRFQTRIYIPLPTVDDIQLLIMKKYADFLKIKENEVLGLFETSGQRFIENEQDGYLILKKDKDNNIIDDITEYCNKHKEELLIKEIYYDGPKKTIENKCIKQDEEVTNDKYYESNNILLDKEYIKYLSYGINLNETRLMSTSHTEDEYIIKKRETIKNKIFNDTLTLARRLHYELFSNSDIDTLMNKHFIDLSNRSLKDSNRYLIKLKGREFSVDSKSIDDYILLDKTQKITNRQSGKIEIDNINWIFFDTVNEYKDDLQLKICDLFENYWVDEDEFINKFDDDTDNSSFFCNNKILQQDMKILSKIRNKDILVISKIKYICNDINLSQRSFEHLMENLKKKQIENNPNTLIDSQPNNSENTKILQKKRNDALNKQKSLFITKLFSKIFSGAAWLLNGIWFYGVKAIHYIGDVIKEGVDQEYGPADIRDETDAQKLINNIDYKQNSLREELNDDYKKLLYNNSIDNDSYSSFLMHNMTKIIFENSIQIDTYNLINCILSKMNYTFVNKNKMVPIYIRCSNDQITGLYQPNSDHGTNIYENLSNSNIKIYKTNYSKIQKNYWTITDITHKTHIKLAYLEYEGDYIHECNKYIWYKFTDTDKMLKVDFKIYPQTEEIIERENNNAKPFQITNHSDKDINGVYVPIDYKSNDNRRKYYKHNSSIIISIKSNNGNWEIHKGAKKISFFKGGSLPDLCIKQIIFPFDSSGSSEMIEIKGLSAYEYYPIYIDQSENQLINGLYIPQENKLCVKDMIYKNKNNDNIQLKYNNQGSHWVIMDASNSQQLATVSTEEYKTGILNESSSGQFLEKGKPSNIIIITDCSKILDCSPDNLTNYRNKNLQVHKKNGDIDYDWKLTANAKIDSNNGVRLEKKIGGKPEYENVLFSDLEKWNIDLNKYIKYICANYYSANEYEYFKQEFTKINQNDSFDKENYDDLLDKFLNNFGIDRILKKTIEKLLRSEIYNHQINNFKDFKTKFIYYLHEVLKKDIYNIILISNNKNLLDIGEKPSKNDELINTTEGKEPIRIFDDILNTENIHLFNSILKRLNFPDHDIQIYNREYFNKSIFINIKPITEEDSKIKEQLYEYIEKCLYNFKWDNPCFYKEIIHLSLKTNTGYHNVKKYRTFLINPQLVMETFLKPNSENRFLPATVKEDLAELLYYESERIAPTNKDKKNKAYEWCNKKGYKWAKDLKIK